MIDLEARLSELGALLDLDDGDLSVVVAAEIAGPLAPRRAVRAPRIAAAVLVVIAAVAAALPSTRSTVAGWLGLERVDIERRDDLIVPATLPPITAPPVDDTANPLGAATTVLGGTTVLLGTIDGRLNDVFISKTVAADAPVVSLVIDGMPALWIAEPHEVIVERGGEPVSERIAGSTLLWQDGDVLWRVEGFAALDDAVAFARSR